MKEQPELVRDGHDGVRSEEEHLSALEKEIALEKLKKVFPNNQENKSDGVLLDLNEKGEPILSTEQQEELNFVQVNTFKFYKSLSEGLIKDKDYEEREKIIYKFGVDLELDGINPSEYLLWHMITSSGSHERQNLRFDLSDKRIWNFIKSLYGVK
jgi:hypothetical protein